MGCILSLVKKAGFTCLPCDVLNLDIERFQEYRDSDEHPAETPFERPEVSFHRKKVDLLALNVPPILKYFLDGARRTYKVADVIHSGRFLPVVAGQVGVAVMNRLNDASGVRPIRELCTIRNLLAFPDLVNPDDLADLQDRVNKNSPVHFDIVRYRLKENADLVDLGAAKILVEMHETEVKTVYKMAEQRLLGNTSLLVVDGSLRFGRRLDLTQFRNVVGISKSFRPSFVFGRGKNRADVGSITSSLDFGERTTVFKTTEDEKVIGMWYMRIRPPRQMSDPLQGVVKMELHAVDPEDKEDGFDGERIDGISGHILRERNVTPFKADSRWANHLYPIYLAESYLKAAFMSNTHFRALF